MEKRRIDPEKQREIQKAHGKILIAMVAVIAAYVIYTFITNRSNTLVFQLLIAAFAIVFAVLTDVVEPKKLGLFEDMTLGQRSAYIKITLLNVLGIGAILFWVLSTKKDGGSLYPVVIYILAFQLKRRVRPDFEEPGEEEETEE